MAVTIKSTYMGDLRTENIHLASGAKFITGASTDDCGKGEVFLPAYLQAMSLDNCILPIKGIKAMDNDINIDVSNIMAGDVCRVAEVIASFTFSDKGCTQEQKQMLENVAGPSSVTISLHSKLKQTFIINW